MRHIRAISLDFYNTIVRFEPLREEIQTAACAEFGITVDPAAVRRSYPAADHFLSQENGALPLSRRTPEQVSDLWTQYETLLLAGAGVQVDQATARRIFENVRDRRQGFALFPDVIPLLQAARDRGYETGVVTNYEGGLAQTLVDLGIAEYLSFAVTSEEVGVAKPHARIFEEALQRAGLQPQDVVHVGDQPHADVLGATGAGITPILLDRDGVHGGYSEARVIRSLTELPQLLRNMETEQG